MSVCVVQHVIRATFDVLLEETAYTPGMPAAMDDVNVRIVPMSCSAIDRHHIPIQRLPTIGQQPHGTTYRHFTPPIRHTINTLRISKSNRRHIRHITSRPLILNISLHHTNVRIHNTTFYYSYLYLQCVRVYLKPVKCQVNRGTGEDTVFVRRCMFVCV